MRLYDDLACWYPLLDPAADHEREAAAYTRIGRAALPVAVLRPTLLELGAGAGNNGLYLKRDFDCTLVDPAEPMLVLSRAQNPECRHLPGDMRSLRLGQTFDLVLIHDAIVYMHTEAQLQAAVLTAWLHTRPGGIAIFAPDSTRECQVEGTQVLQGSDGDRALRGICWTWLPDPVADRCRVEYALLLRDAGVVTSVHDSHVEGLFAEATWLRILRMVGYTVRTEPRALDADAAGAYFDRIFVCERSLHA